MECPPTKGYNAANMAELRADSGDSSYHPLVPFSNLHVFFMSHLFLHWYGESFSAIQLGISSVIEQ